MAQRGLPAGAAWALLVFAVTSEPRMELLRTIAQEFLDSWYPGIAVTVDWTGEAYLLQLARGFRLADVIWAPRNCIENGSAQVTLRCELLRTASWLAREG